MVDGRPQHQPFAHLDGAGAKEDHQPPHHQQKGDGGAAGAGEMDKKRFKIVRKSNDIHGYMVGQQPHQTQPRLSVAEVVDKGEGMWSII